MQVVWYENKAIVFTTSPTCDGIPEIHATGISDLTPAKLLQKFDNNNILRIVSANADETFGLFAEKMRRIEAAGGLVEAPHGQVLMIKRRGWWDLPKGHVEPGESNAQAALREVSEETGLKHLELTGLLTTTQHFYDTYGDWEMKRTWWYGMRTETPENLVPQTEESITEACWSGGKELWQKVSQSYGTIREVFASWVETKE